MRLTKADGAVLLGAIDAELESQKWRRLRRAEYSTPVDRDTEKFLQDEDAKRADKLRAVRDKIRAQL